MCNNNHTLIVKFHICNNILSAVSLFEVKIGASPVRAVAYSSSGHYILVGSDEAFVQVRTPYVVVPISNPPKPSKE